MIKRRKCGYEKTFPAVVFANTNILKKLFRICLDESEIKDLPEKKTLHIYCFNKNMVDGYVDRQGMVFSAGKYSMADQMCYTEFLRYYYLICKSIHHENQPNELTIIYILVNYLKILPLMISKEKLHLCWYIMCLININIRKTFAVFVLSIPG